MAENNSAVTEIDSADYDARNKEEDPLIPADIKGDANDNEDPDSETGHQDPNHLPNNDLYFTDDVFLETVTGMNNTTRH